MVLLVTVALHHRDHFSQGNARRAFGYEAYHWGIIVSPLVSQAQDCWAYDATDKCYIDPATMRVVNPTMDWWFRSTDIDPVLSDKLLGRIIIGQVPDGTTISEIHMFF
mgnify:CR=1 FL=1